MSQFDVALVAYAPNGARLGPLPAPSRITSAVNPLNDMPSLSFEYLESAPGSSFLNGPVEVAVEVFNPQTANWIEPFNSRYMLIDWDGNTASNTGRKSYTCPGYVYNLDKAVTRPRSKADMSEDISQATAAAAAAKAAYNAACATLRTAAGASSKAGVVFAAYEPTISNGTIWVDYDETPYTVKVGNRPKGSAGSWVSKTGTTVVNAAVAAYEAKLVYDDANAGITRAKNDKSFDREIQAANAGKVMNQLLSEAQARGNRLPGLTWDFSASVDSAGQPWAIQFDEPLVIKAGQSALGVLQSLTDQGLCDWVMEGRELHIYNPDTALKRDRTNVQLLVGTDIKDAPDKGTYGSLTHNILFLGEEGTTFELTNNAPMSPWGRWEKSVSQGGVTSRSVGTMLGQAQLDAGAAPRTESTRELVFQPFRPIPYFDYRVGDTISSVGGSGVSESMRIRQITLTREPDGTAGGNLVLGDRFLEAEVRSRRQMDGILNGTIPRGDGSMPGTPVVPSERRPEAPRDLVATAQNYVSPAGETIGRLLVDWEWDGVDTNGTPIEDNGFQVQIRPDHAGEPWVSAKTTPLNTMTLENVRVRTEGGDVEVYQLRVRTVAYNGRTSAWSDTVTVMMEADTTPPPVPSALQPTAEYGVISAYWDGLGAGGEPMPHDFRAVEGEVAQSPAGPWTLFASYPLEGNLQVPWQTTYGEYFLRARSVDLSGNYSAYSAVTSVITKPLVELPDVHDMIDEFEQKWADAMDGVGIAQASANGKNNITHSTSDPTITGDEVAGDLWWKYSDSTMEVLVGTWQFNGTEYVAHAFGHQIFDSIDAAKISVGFMDGARIRAKSIWAGAIMVGDFTNLCTIDPVADVQTDTPAAYTTMTVGDYARKAPGGADYLMFKDQSGPVPFESGDWLRVSFDAVADSTVNVPTALYVYENETGTTGAISQAGDTVEITTTPGHYSFDIQVPDLSVIDGGRSWIFGLVGANSRLVGVRNVRAYKKAGATLIAPNSISTPMLQAEAIESYHIKSNSIETDRLIGGFADFIVITGSTLQTVAAANSGIKLEGGTNRLRAWNAAGDQTVNINGNNGDIWLGKSQNFRIWGASGDLSIGNGKFIVDGGTGNVTMSNATLTAGTVNGSTLNGSTFNLLGTGDGVGFDYHILVDSYGMTAVGMHTPDSDTPATIRAHQVGAEGGALGEEYDQGPAVANNATQLVIRSPRNTGVTTNRCAIFLQAWEGNNGFKDQPRLAVSGDLLMNGGGGVYGTGYVAIDAASGSILDVGIQASYVRSTLIRDTPYTFASNMYVTSNGHIGQTSSAARFKIDAKEMELSDELLEIPVKDWVDKTSHEEAQALRGLGVRTADQQALLDSGTQEVRIPGVVAEDVEAVAGGSQFVSYNVDGETQGVAYDRLAMAQIAVLNRQLKAERKRNDDLEARLKKLEERL